MTEAYYPEPIWPLYLTQQQIAAGDWLRVEPEEVVDYQVNPLAYGWEARYKPAAIERLKALGLPRLGHQE